MTLAAQNKFYPLKLYLSMFADTYSLRALSLKHGTKRLKKIKNAKLSNQLVGSTITAIYEELTTDQPARLRDALNFHQKAKK